MASDPELRYAWILCYISSGILVVPRIIQHILSDLRPSYSNDDVIFALAHLWYFESSTCCQILPIAVNLRCEPHLIPKPKYVYSAVKGRWHLTLSYFMLGYYVILALAYMWCLESFSTFC